MPDNTTRTSSFNWSTVVLQPTSLCNLNCSYCYLPDRKARRFLNLDVANRVADTIRRRGQKVRILWHGGEPLACGIRFFERAVEPFQELVGTGHVRHSLQTNATLVNDQWCDFLKRNRFRVGVSLDGNRKHTLARVNWSGAPAFDDALRGIGYLKKHAIRFGIIAVVNFRNVHEPEKMYEFLAGLEPNSISINIEESEGLNISNTLVTRDLVDDFWPRMFQAWREKPVVTIRQFREGLIVMNELLSDSLIRPSPANNVYPTIDTEGNVVLLSPEFIAVPEPERRRFIVGNVLEDDLDAIVQRATSAWYVQDFFSGVKRCSEECEYFDFCGGGQASNKYFETGKIDVTETDFCYNTRIAPVKAMLKELQKENPIKKEIVT